VERLQPSKLAEMEDVERRLATDESNSLSSQSVTLVRKKTKKSFSVNYRNRNDVT
jgi:hypothetical protein